MAKSRRKTKKKGKARTQSAWASSLALFPRNWEDDSPSWRMLPIWLAVALVLRGIIALGGDFVLHPDEIMQYLEPAHRAVFGNGVVFWEYEYGARSWLVPGLVAAVLWFLDSIGLGDPWIYVYAVKIVFCAISLLVPWGCYHFARRALGEDCARLSLVLTCLWPYLVVFAHKPFTEFVATSLFFGALGFACRPASRGKAGAATFGAMLALICAVRMHYLPLAGLLWIARVIATKRQWVLATITGGLSMLALVGIFEIFTWGKPFHSYYANYIFNMEFDKFRTGQEIYFYFPRLLFATAGGALVMLYAFFRHPKRHMLIISLMVVTFTLHMSQAHKEFRFIFVLLPMCLIVLCDQLAMWSTRWPKAINHWSATAVASIFLVLIGGNLVDDRWMHVAASRERGDVQYLFGQSNIYDVYLQLARLDDVKGVVHLGDPYFNTPGYYYLHHDVPFYDVNVFESAVKTANVTMPEELVSHLVASGEMPDYTGLVKIKGEGDGYSYAYLKGASEVRLWKSNTPKLVSEGTTALARTKLGHRSFGTPKVFEFSDAQ